MIYDGVIAKIFDDGEDKIFLFFLDKEEDVITDGLNLDDNNIKVYQDLTYDSIVTVEVSLKDGTKEVEVDLYDFVDGEYGKYDIFIHITDLLSFRLGQKDDDGNLNYQDVKDIILDGNFQGIAKDCIIKAKNVDIKKEKYDV